MERVSHHILFVAVGCAEDSVLAKGENIDYIEETKRPLRLRFNEHVRDMICRRNDTPMGYYFRTTHHEAGHTLLPFEVSTL